MSEDQTIFEFSEDISEAEAPDPLPPGDYEGEIRAVAGARSQSTDNQYAAVSFIIPPDQFPADYDSTNAPDGMTIIYRRVPLEDDRRSRFFLRRFCDAIGAPMSKTIDLTEWLGKMAKLTVANEDWEGLPRSVITRVSEAV